MNKSCVMNTRAGYVIMYIQNDVMIFKTIFSSKTALLGTGCYEPPEVINKLTLKRASKKVILHKFHALYFRNYNGSGGKTITKEQIEKLAKLLVTKVSLRHFDLFLKCFSVRISKVLYSLMSAKANINVISCHLHAR